MRKSTKTTILIVFVAAALLIATGFLTSGFQNWSKDDIVSKVTPQLNKSNLYTIDCVEIADTFDGKGVRIDVDEDTGALKLNGTASVSLEGEEGYKIGSITLSKVQYTFTSFDQAALSGAYLTAICGDQTVYFDFTPGNVIDVTSASADYDIYLNIAEGAKFSNIVIEPVIVAGTTAGEFWD
jgi:hypothetical protein